MASRGHKPIQVNVAVKQFYFDADHFVVYAYPVLPNTTLVFSFSTSTERHGGVVCWPALLDQLDLSFVQGVWPAFCNSIHLLAVFQAYAIPQGQVHDLLSLLHCTA
jgi:hypothetical protein